MPLLAASLQPPVLYPTRKYARLLVSLFVAPLLGHLLALQPKELPSGVQTSMAILTQNSTLTSITPLQLLGEPLFTLEITKNAQSREWILDSSGAPVSVQVPKEELPPAVQQAVSKELTPGIVLEGISLSYEANEMVFEIELRSEKGERALCLHSNGEILSREIPLSELPRPVQKALTRHSQGARPEKCFRSEEEANLFFTVGLARGDTPIWITFAADGSLAEQEEHIEWNAAPAAVQNAILQRLHSQEHLRIIRRKTDLELIFEITALTSVKLDAFSVSPDGTVTEIQP